jgi:hypothetical protein
VNGISRDRCLAGALDSLLPGEKVVILSPSVSGNFSLPSWLDTPIEWRA